MTLKNVSRLKIKRGQKEAFIKTGVSIPSNSPTSKLLLGTVIKKQLIRKKGNISAKVSYAFNLSVLSGRTSLAIQHLLGLLDVLVVL